MQQFTPGLGYHYYSMRGEPVSFVFATPSAPEGALTVTTIEPTDITETTATCGGSAVSNDGTFVLMKGVCWATHPQPTTNDSYSENGSGPGTFTTEITGLDPNTVYYVRAYAASVKGTNYGNEVSFTTLEEGDFPMGAINGMFSINENGDQVYFSQGNLQYIGSASTPYWKFADNQWDYLGTSTGQDSNDQNVDRDLFGWGTSGYDHGANCFQPWSTSQTHSDYYAYGSYAYNLYDQIGQADWGYNPISNGGNQANQWRTLTKNEWVYVFNTRTTSSGIRYAKAKVNNVNGVILLPDNWNTSYYTLSTTNSTSAYFSSNIISASQWDTLEQHGAVFLPAAGYRSGASVSDVGNGGWYWSASYYSSYYAWGVYFSNSYLSTAYAEYLRYFGRSVRLVAPAEN